MKRAPKRQYRPFPYLPVLAELLAGKGYRATALKFGYLEEDSADPTKRFRTLLRHARNVGFEHEGKQVLFPKISRNGQPDFGSTKPPAWMASMLPKGRRARQSKPNDASGERSHPATIKSSLNL